MRERRGLLKAGGLALAALGAALWLSPASAADMGPFKDSHGPHLVIEVGGQDHGKIMIDLLPKIAPKTVVQIVALAKTGAYNSVVFHRVIPGFMAQMGDVKFGKHCQDNSMAGMGGSDLPNVPAEFSSEPFLRGTVGMARSSDPNSGNSQFFIMFQPAPHLNGQYRVFGHVIEGMDVVDKIKKGSVADNGSVTNPDYMKSVTFVE